MEFVVLPDHPSSAVVLSLLPPSLRVKIIYHHSGRPWIVGQWSDREITWAVAGEKRTALLGCSSVGVSELADRLNRVRTIDDLDTIAKTVPGCFHLIASIGGVVRAQGSLSTACQIFHGSALGVTLATDRPQVIAGLTGAGFHEDVLALHLLWPYGPPWPLSGRCVWRGVEALPSGHCLEIGPDGTQRVRRWWVPPEPELPLTAGASLLRETLFAAVDARTHGGDTVSADLSGGIDSTCLCFVATRDGRPLVTTHYASADPANEDRRWAEECIADLPISRHVVVPPGTSPVAYAEAVMTQADLEGPSSVVNRGVTEHLARLVSELGSTRHLTGHGSDELFQPSAMCLHALLRRHPMKSIRYARAMKSMRRWTWSTMLRNFARSPSYVQWLSATADRITEPSPTKNNQVGWELPARLPPWATPDAAVTVRRMLQDTATQAPQPIAALPVQHEMIRLTQINGTALRHSSTIGAPFGVSFQAPYIDDRVLEVALSIRLEDRIRIGSVKPVLAAAMRGVAPDRLLDRTSKSDAIWISYAGWRRHRRELLDLCDDSFLARMGLIDPSLLRSAFLGLHLNGRTMAPLDPTFKSELWLRALPKTIRHHQSVFQPLPERQK